MRVPTSSQRRFHRACWTVSAQASAFSVSNKLCTSLDGGFLKRTVEGLIRSTLSTLYCKLQLAASHRALPSDWRIRKVANFHKPCPNSSIGLDPATTSSKHFIFIGLRLHYLTTYSSTARTLPDASAFSIIPSLTCSVLFAIVPLSIVVLFLLEGTPDYIFPHISTSISKFGRNKQKQLQCLEGRIHSNTTTCWT